jgi:hypothetical protein
MSEIKRYDLDDYEYRDYDFEGRVYRIDKPVAFFWAPGHTTHRVLDANGVVHIVPAPGERGCVLRYRKTEGHDPVKF